MLSTLVVWEERKNMKVAIEFLRIPGQEQGVRRPVPLSFRKKSVGLVGIRKKTGKTPKITK
jgi:hypothetical protein